MAEIALYIDISSGSLIEGLNSSRTVSASSIPFNYGDTPTLKIYLLQKIPTAGITSSFPYSIVNTNGISIQFFLDDGTINGTVYTSQVTFTADPTSQFYTADLALNTSNLATLLGSSTSASAWLKIAYIQNGKITTPISEQVNIGVGIPSTVGTPPPGQTALSVEVANITYVPLKPVAGQAIQLAATDGGIIVLYAKRQADGSLTFQAEPLS